MQADVSHDSETSLCPQPSFPSGSQSPSQGVDLDRGSFLPSCLQLCLSPRASGSLCAHPPGGLLLPPRHPAGTLRLSSTEPPTPCPTPPLLRARVSVPELPVAPGSPGACSHGIRLGGLSQDGPVDCVASRPALWGQGKPLELQEHRTGLFPMRPLGLPLTR